MEVWEGQAPPPSPLVMERSTVKLSKGYKSVKVLGQAGVWNPKIPPEVAEGSGSHSLFCRVDVMAGLSARRLRQTSGRSPMCSFFVFITHAAGTTYH